MWTTTTTKKTIKKLSDKTSKAMDSMFESMDGMFEKMNEIVSDVVSDDDDDDDDLLETEGVFKVDSDKGVISITANNGHLIIEGQLKSLKVNGVNYDTIMTNPLKE